MSLSKKYRAEIWRGLADENGQTLIVAAILMIVLIGFLGLAIDIGQLRYAKRNLQLAADAAAIAAGLEIRVCGSTPNCPAMQAAAQNALVENGFTTSTLLANCASNTNTTLTLTVNNPPCALGASDPNSGSGKNNYVEVLLSEQQRTWFARVVGFDNVPITVRAEAVRSNTAPCIYALDPSASGAISVLIGVGVKSNCGIVDESSSPTALTCIVGLLISAPKISVTGGTGGLLCGSTPPPTTGVPVPNPADPLAYLPVPPTAGDPCGITTSSPYTGSPKIVSIVGLASTVVFNPGVYCGGISITALAATNVTFNPGMYILKQGPGLLGPLTPTSGLTLTVVALSSITGQGVTFYNASNLGGISITTPGVALGLSNFNLNAPTNGTYSGILFFQAHGVTQPGTFSANLLSGSSMNGAIYERDATVSYGVSAIASSYNILVANKLQFTATVLTAIGNDYSTLVNGSPLGGDSATLVQ